MLTLRECENRIFQKYKTSGTTIIPDGALGKEYEYARRRLLVILKEPNDPDGSWAASGGDIRDFGVSGKYDRPATWNNLARWSALVDNPKLSIEEIDVADPDKRCEHLRRIAVVNLKKTSGQSTSRYLEIKQNADQHRSLLLEQLRLYRPDVTITGNVFSIVRDLLGETQQREDDKCFFYFKNETLGVCIDFYHPQPRFSNKSLFSRLKSELQYHQFK
jgi:hypothetical protein